MTTGNHPKTRIADMALDSNFRQRIDRVVVEHRQRDRIRQYGLAPLCKLLLVGPSGTGKTMTAAALAGELGLPLFTIHGEPTNVCQGTPGVYVFAEFNSPTLLPFFLQLLRMGGSNSLVIGTTHYRDRLDRALFPRFDVIFEYALPSKEIATKIMQARLGLLDTADIDWSEAAAAAAAESLSHAEITHACHQVSKTALLEGTTKVSPVELIQAFRERRTPNSIERRGKS